MIWRLFRKYPATMTTSLAGIAVIIWIRLANVDKSETRLLVDHWPIWLGLAVAVISSLAIETRQTRRRPEPDPPRETT